MVGPGQFGSVVRAPGGNQAVLGRVWVLAWNRAGFRSRPEMCMLATLAVAGYIRLPSVRLTSFPGKGDTMTPNEGYRVRH